MKFIGFLGTDKYDIIHYTAKVLRKLGQETLLIDASARKALTASVPMTSDKVFDYNGIDFVSSLSAAKEYADLREYDYILIDFGFQKENPLIHRCNEIWLVSDMQKHNIMYLRSLKLKNSQPRFLILRERTYTKIIDYLVQLLKPLGIQKNTVFTIKEDDNSYKRMLDCMYNDNISMKKISKDMTDIIKNILAQDFTESDLNKALRACKGGR